MDGRVRLERINGSPYISARVFIQGKLVRKSTRVTTLAAATDVARKWYQGLLAQDHGGKRIHGRLFLDAAEAFLTYANEAESVRKEQRKNYRQKLSLLRPFFLKVRVDEIDASFLTALRSTRAKTLTKNGDPIKAATLKKDMDFVRQVLRHAKEIEKALDVLPTFPSFAGDVWGVHPSPSPYLTSKQYRHLLAISQKRLGEADLNPRVARQRKELHAFIGLCVGAALRTGEAYSLHWSDCTEVRFEDSGEIAIKMLVTGKHSKGSIPEHAFALKEGVNAFRLLKRISPDAKPTDKVFREHHRDGLRELFEAAGLRDDPTAGGKMRHSKCLRPTGLSLRLKQQPDVHLRHFAKWARTSVGMIEKFYDQNKPELAASQVLSGGKRKKVAPPVAAATPT